MKNVKLFSMIAVCAAMLLAGCSNGTDEPATYTVTVTSGGNGTAVADKTTAEAGATITLTATANGGCEFVTWTTVGGEITFSPNANSTNTTFTMPAANVSVKAEFVVRGVLINGTVWALCNVDAPGTFAANPEDAGMFYQWNRRTGWSSTDPLISSPAGVTWAATNADGDEWEAANDPCPAGWRVPTNAECIALCDSGKTTNEWTTLNGVDVCRFTDRESGNSVFFPAAGLRGISSAEVGGVGIYGGYWQATAFPSSILGYTLTMPRYTDEVYPSLSNLRANGFSVRCVAK